MREVWGAYSVRDHLAKKAFIADVMLYDKLVIPVPAADDRTRWESEGWDQARQEHILGILGDRAVTIVWDAELRAKWRSRWEAAKDLGASTSREAMRMTPTVLLERVPRTATGVVAVAAFDTVDELRQGLNMRENLPALGSPPQPPIYSTAGQLAAVIGREFLVPEDPNSDDDELLRRALEISGDTKFRRKRAAYWRWQQEFMREATVVDQRGIDDAVQEMGELIEEEKAEARRSKIRLGVSFAFAVGAASTAMFMPAVEPVSIAGAFLSVGGWAIDHALDVMNAGSGQAGPAAVCLSAQREFGWKRHT